MSAAQGARSGSQQGRRTTCRRRRSCGTKQGFRQRIEIAADELGLDPRVSRQPASGRDALGRKVDAGDNRPPPRPGERVEAEVTLQVEKPLSRHVTDLLDVHPVQSTAARLERLDAIEVATQVHPGRLVPVDPVHLQLRFLHVRLLTSPTAQSAMATQASVLAIASRKGSDARTVRPPQSVAR